MENFENDIKKIKMKSGDVILFAGRGYINTPMTWITKSKWTHVGLVVKYNNILYILEAVKNVVEFVDVILTNSKMKKNGIILSPLIEKLKQYKYDIRILILNKILSKKQNIKIIKFYKENLENSKWDNYIIFNILNVNDRKNKKLKRIFCSELIAKIYKIIGILPEVIKSTRVFPGDFDIYQKNGTILNDDYKYNKKTYNINKGNFIQNQINVKQIFCDYGYLIKKIYK